MKILHFADAHIGVTTHGQPNAQGINDRVVDFLDSFDFIIEFIAQNDVDLVLFAGDMFHSNRPSPALISEVSLRVADIAKMCPIILIPGNHDQAVSRVSTLDFLNALELRNVYVSDEPTYYVVNDVLISAIPYPIHSTYGVSKTSKNADFELIRSLYETIEKHWVTGMHKRARILLFHGTYEGAQWGGYTNVSLAKDAHLPLELMEALAEDWDYVALGHIHIHQAVGNIVYAGSIDRVDFGEASEDKGFVLISINDDNSLKWQFMKLPTRPMLKISIDLRDVPVLQHNQDVAEVLYAGKPYDKEALVKVEIHVSGHDASPNIDTIYNYFADKVHRLCGVNVIRHHFRDDRREQELEDLSHLPADAMLEEYLIRNETSDEDIDAILELFDDIYEQISQED